jgi:hypothetical protein
MISDKAGCDRRKGSPLRSDERAEERAPLTAVASGQIMQLSGTKKTKEISSGQNNQERPFTQNPGHYRVFAFSLSVFAVDDLGFRRMHLQVAFRQPGLKLSLESLGFLLGPTVHQPVIRIPTPWEFRMCPRHPYIKCIVHEKIGQNRANHTALRRTAASLFRGPIFQHHRSPEPSFDVQQGPLARDMFPNGP